MGCRVAVGHVALFSCLGNGVGGALDALRQPASAPERSVLAHGSTGSQFGFGGALVALGVVEWSQARLDQFYASAWRPALRHWCASTLLAEGAPLTAVAAHLGDVVETVSRTYVHWLRDEHDVPSAVLDRVLAPEPRGAGVGLAPVGAAE